MKAVVVYRSVKGKTRRYAEAIGAELRTLGVETTVASVGEADMDAVASADIVMLGCWTSGWFVVHQHPDKPWVDFVRDMPAVDHARTGLFTTYLLAVGGMFDSMAERIGRKLPAPSAELKSRSGELSAGDREALRRLVQP